MRRKRNYRKNYQADVRHDNVAIGRFINYLMRDGKNRSPRAFFTALLTKLRKTAKENPADVFKKALENASPLVEVASRRIGGANYQVPREVRPKKVHAFLPLDNRRRPRQKGRAMAEKLAEELLAASKKRRRGDKEKQDTHRMAEANRAFAHFSW